MANITKDHGRKWKTTIQRIAKKAQPQPVTSTGVIKELPKIPVSAVTVAKSCFIQNDML